MDFTEKILVESFAELLNEPIEKQGSLASGLGSLAKVLQPLGAKSGSFLSKKLIQDSMTPAEMFSLKTINADPQALSRAKKLKLFLRRRIGPEETREALRNVVDSPLGAMKKGWSSLTPVNKMFYAGLPLYLASQEQLPSGIGEQLGSGAAFIAAGKMPLLPAIAASTLVGNAIHGALQPFDPATVP